MNFPLLSGLLELPLYSAHSLVLWASIISLLIPPFAVLGSLSGATSMRPWREWHLARVMELSSLFSPVQCYSTSYFPAYFHAVPDSHSLLPFQLSHLLKNFWGLQFPNHTQWACSETNWIGYPETCMVLHREASNRWYYFTAANGERNFTPSQIWFPSDQCEVWSSRRR